jgi:hypothetical protein
MLFDFQRHGGDRVVDRWIDNVFLPDLTARPEPPRARFVKRKPVTLRAMHVHPRTDLLPTVEASDLSDDAAAWIMLCERAGIFARSA